MKLSVVFEYFDRATAPLKRTEKTFRGFQKTINLTQNCLWKFNQTAELMGRMGDTMGQLMQPGVQFQQSMADLSSITGIAGSDLERLGKIARETGKSSGLGASGAANAFALLASQIDVSKIGITGLIELQRKTITLAQASGMSMQDAANSMAGTINQFGLQADEAGRIINVLAAGSKYGAAEIPQLSESFKVVGAAANAAGLSVEQTAGAIETLSKNNLKGSEAGTALRNVILKMQTAMGVDFRKTSLEEALVKLKPHLRDATYMSNLFGMENVAAAQFLVANSDMVKEMTDRVTDTNVATEQAAVRTDTWSQKLKVQAAQFNDYAITLQENFGGLMYGIQVLGQSSSMLLTLAPVGKMMMGIAGGAWSAGVGVLKFGRVIRMLAVAKAARSVETYARAVSMCGRTGRMAAGLLAVYNAVTGKSTWLMLKNSAVTKISAAALWLKNGAVAAASLVTAGWNALTHTATWLQLRQVIATQAQAVWTSVSSKAMAVAGLMTSLWSKRMAVATWFQNGLIKVLRVGRVFMVGSLIPALAGVAASTWAWTTALLANPITWVVVGIGALVAAIVACWMKFAGFRAVVLTVWDTIKGFGMAVWNWLVAPWKAAWEIVSGIGKAIGKLFGGGSWEEAGKELSDGFSKGMDAGIGSVKKAVGGFKNTATGIGGNYNLHLTEERAKQQQKEEKEKIGENKGRDTGGIIPEVVSPEFRVEVPPVAGQDVTMPEFIVPDIEVPQQQPSFISGPVPDIASPEIEITEEQRQFVILPAPEGDVKSPEIRMPETTRQPDPVIMADPSGTDPVDFRLPEIVQSVPQNNNITHIEQQVTRMDSFSRTDVPAAGLQPANISVSFQPVVHISAELTQKTKDDFLTLLRGYGEELTRMIEEQQRKEGRGAYAIS